MDQDRNCIREQWPNYTAIEKIKYIFSYYGIAIVCLLAGLAAAAFLFGDIQKPRAQEAIFIMAAETELPSQAVSSMQTELAGLLDLDADSQKCVIESSCTGSANRESEASMSAYMQSGRVDLFIAPEEVFNRYASTGYLMELDDARKAGFVDEAAVGRNGKEHYFYASQVDYSQGGAVTELPYHPHEKTEDSGWYGIYLEQGAWSGCVAGIMANCPHREHIKDSLRYVVLSE